MAIEPIKGFYVHDEDTNTDGVAKYDYPSVDGEPVGFADVDIIIGTNRYLASNNTVTASSHTKRASTFPTLAQSDILNIYPKTGYSVGAYQQKTDGTWEQITDGALDTYYSVKLSGTGYYFCQVISSVDIPSDEVPFRLSYGVTEHITKQHEDSEALVEVPLAINVGENVYLEDGILKYNSHANRASVRPFRCVAEKYIVRSYIPEESYGNRVYQVTVYLSKDNEYWEEVVTARTGKFTLEVNKGDYLAFHIQKNPSSAISATGDIMSLYVDNVGFLTIESEQEIDVLKLHNEKKKQVQVFEKKKTSNEAYGNCDLRGIFLTDVHEETVRLQRAVSLVNGWGNLLDVVINGGDTARLVDTEDLSWYNNAISDCVVPVLNTVGNHDAWSSLGVLETDPTVPYNLIIAKVAADSNIVQPSNAAADGLNYYYKDFNSAVRVVVLDCMFWDNAQKAWFTSVLADAKTNSLHVVCVTHASFPWADMETVDCLWSKAGVPGRYSDSAAIYDPTRTNIEAAEVVQDFIEDGGTFVAWLTGHQHGDDVHILPNYGNQFVVTMPAFVQRASMIQKNDDPDTYNYDCLTYVAVDCSQKCIKFLRIGADIDMYGVKHNGLCIDYGSNELIASW